MPSLDHARRYAKEVKCRTSLRAIAVGWKMYLEEHPESLPPAVSLPTEPDDLSIAAVLARQVEQAATWQCPNDDRRYFLTFGTSYEYYPGLAIPALMELPDPQAELRSVIRKMDERPAVHPVIADAEAFHPSGQSPVGRLSTYHDGHVDWLRLDD